MLVVDYLEEGLQGNNIRSSVRDIGLKRQHDAWWTVIQSSRCCAINFWVSCKGAQRPAPLTLTFDLFSCFLMEDLLMTCR